MFQNSVSNSQYAYSHTYIRQNFHEIMPVVTTYDTLWDVLCFCLRMIDPCQHPFASWEMSIFHKPICSTSNQRLGSKSTWVKVSVLAPGLKAQLCPLSKVSHPVRTHGARAASIRKVERKAPLAQWCWVLAEKPQPRNGSHVVQSGPQWEGETKWVEQAQLEEERMSNSWRHDQPTNAGVSIRVT